MDTVFSHKVWTDVSPTVKKVTYPMLADPDGEISRLYGVYDEDRKFALRAIFWIDPEGMIQALSIYNEPIARNTDEVIRVLKAIQFHKKTGQVAPAGWKEGEPGLTPGIDLAGKL